jgi:hypothetical protein
MLQKLKLWFIRYKRILIPAISVFVIASIAGGGYLYAIRNGLVARTNPAGSGQDAEPAIKIVPSPLTGLDVTKDLAERPVTGVMIENSPEARPQSGLRDAGVVFEAIAEGGITRFLALYQEDQPKLIGPVRSLRPYYLDWARGFESSVAHVGGSEEALSLARSVPGFRDLDQFSNGAYFFRSTDRYAPHNVYTRTSLLDQASKQKGYGESDFTSISRKKPKPAETPTATSITIDYSAPLFKASYSYDKKNNRYNRSQAGKPHIDRETSKQLFADVVVVMKINWSVKSSGHSVYGTTEGGDVLIFQDGLVSKGKWSKASRSAQIKFTNGEGTEIKLNPGRTWIGALPTSRSVSYQ